MPTITSRINFSDNIPQLKERIAAGTGEIEVMKSAVDKAARSLGQDLFRAAHNMTAAIDQLGGVTKLTAAEQLRANTMLEKAIEKYKLMGMTAPPAMVEMAAATKRVATETETAQTKTASWKDQLGGLAGALGITFSIGAVVGFGRELLRMGDEFTKMAEKAEMSTDEVQRLNYIADQTGVSFEGMVGATQNLQQRLGSGDAGLAAAVKHLGLNLDEIKRQTPYDQLLTLGTAVGTLEDPTDRAATSAAVFGKTWKEIAPAIQSDMQALADKAPVMSQATVAALDTAGDQLSAFGLQIKVWAAESYNFLRQGFEGIIGFAYNTVAALLETTAKVVGMAEKIPGASAVMKAMGTDLATLTQDAKWFRDAASGMTTHTDSAKDAVVKLRPEVTTLGEETKKAKDAAEKHARELQETATQARKAEEDLIKMTRAQLGTIEGTRDLTLKTLALNDAFKLTGPAMPIPELRDLRAFTLPAATDVAGLALTVDELQRQGRFGSAALIGLNTQIATLPNVTPAATQAIKDATAAGKSLGETLGENLHGVLANVPNLLKAAFTGGGDLIGAAKAIGVELADAIMTPIIKGLSAAKAAAVGAASAAATVGASAIIAGQDWKGALGGVALATVGVVATAALAAGATVASVATLGAVTFGIGAAAVGVAMLVRHWLGVSEEEKGARAEFESYQQQFGTLDDMISTVGEAYALTGRTGTEAQKDIQAALDATHKNAGEVHGALVKINTVMEEARAKVLAYQAVDEALGHLLETVKTVDFGLPDAFRPMVDRMLEMPGITDNVKASLQGLLDNATPNFSKLEGMAKSYGIELEALGPSFQQAHVTDEAKKILIDFDSLKAAGADVNGVIRGMGDEISHVVQESIKFGSEIPENMRPMIQSLAESGLLLDENKETITDISGLKFGAAVKTDVDKLKDAIELLAEAIGKIPGKIAAIPTQVNVNVQGHYIPPDIPDYAAPDPIPMASGGDFMVTRPTLFLAGEAGPERATFTPRASSSRLSVGSGSVSNIDLRPYLERLERQLKDQREDAASDRQQFPLALARAVRDELQKAAS